MNEYIEDKRFSTKLRIVENVLREKTRWSVSAPDNEVTWIKVHQVVSQYLFNLWRSGGLKGSDRQQAYFVRCDRTTMTNVDIADGKVNIVIGLAFNRPTDFTILKISHQASA